MLATIFYIIKGVKYPENIGYDLKDLNLGF